MNILRMVNPVMAYEWGSKSFIQDLLNDKAGFEKPQAELWMGAHPAASSQIQNGDLLQSLHDIITDDPDDFLGARTATTYNYQLPFLLKVLAADHPLSLQAHPGRKQAKDGFAREEKLGIPYDSPERNYKDECHKPELLVALTEFHALCGFRDMEELTYLLPRFLPAQNAEELTEFIAHPDVQELQKHYASLLNMSAEKREKLLNEYLNNIKSLVVDSLQEKLIVSWTLKLHDLYPNDIGILSPLLMNIIVLKPFEGLYLEPGVLHSYLQGAAMEIMANSDNVLRGGLTNKHIDTEALLNVLDFSAKKITALQAVTLSPTEGIYETPAQEFALSVITHTEDKTSTFIPSGSPEIIFCYEGSFVVENCSQYLPLEQGQSLFIPCEVEGFTVQGKGLIFRAKVNLK